MGNGAIHQFQSSIQIQFAIRNSQSQSQSGWPGLCANDIRRSLIIRFVGGKVGRCKRRGVERGFAGIFAFLHLEDGRWERREKGWEIHAFMRITGMEMRGTRKR